MVYRPASMLRSAPCILCRRSAIQFTARGLRQSSTIDDAPSPLLSKIKNDLKSAMRAKDTARLNVLRAIISETNQSASGPSPIRSDLQVLAILRKRKAASQAAAKEAEQVSREDLKVKQEKEIDILDEYAGKVELVPEAELREAVEATITILRDKSAQGLGKPGVVMKELLRPGGPLDGKPVEKSQLAEIVRQALEKQPQAT